MSDEFPSPKTNFFDMSDRVHRSFSLKNEQDKEPWKIMKNVLICREKSIANEKSLYRCLAPGENQA